MNYDIRKIANYFPDIHSRYYIDTNGTVYTSLSPSNHKIMIGGVKRNIRPFVNSNLQTLNRTNRQICAIPETKDYFLMYDGTVLQRLSTRIKENKQVTVCLIKVCGGNDRGNAVYVARLVAGCFIGNVEGKEIHHIDQDRTNNSADNLEIMSMHEHRGIGNFSKNHS